MIRCPTCHGIAFNISDTPVPGLEDDNELAHLITCTACGMTFALEFVQDDETVCPVPETKAS